MMKRLLYCGVMVLVVVALASAGCVAPPKNQQGSSGGGTSSGGTGTSGGGHTGGSAGAMVTETPAGSTTNATPRPDDTRFLVPVTPYGGEAGSPSLTHPATPEITPIAWNETEIYNNTIVFNYTNLAYAYQLTDPPLFITMVLSPAREEVTKYLVARSEAREGENITVVQDRPNTYFEINIRDRDTGDIVESEGYGGIYSAELEKRITINRAGNYLVEMRGNNIQVGVLMKIREPAATAPPMANFSSTA